MVGKEPRIETIAEKKIIGKRLTMSLSHNRAPELCRSFMPVRMQVENNVTTELLSVQVFDPSFDFKDFTLDTSFERWAACEVTHLNKVPDGMEAYIMKGGLYAVFDYVGTPGDFSAMFQFIFHAWMPRSGYEVDCREHFEVLGEKYRNNDPFSEEEIWIPIKRSGPGRQLLI